MLCHTAIQRSSSTMITGRSEAHPDPYDVTRIREDFPALSARVYENPLVYLDNAASAQKPNVVLDRMMQAYKSEYANVHRGLHFLPTQRRKLSSVEGQR